MPLDFFTSNLDLTEITTLKSSLRTYNPVRFIVPVGCVQTDATLLTNNSQHYWMLHVASVCIPCCMLLDVVARCCAKFETAVKLLAPCKWSQHCWLTTPNIVGSCCARLHVALHCNCSAYLL